ncbi:unnamed protein product [Ambrosiozyma monospora]|uniref:Unnamed protein product n=1 Tax=Ambrosiozyma monospora TaxID=43982 RepID=A0A9W7DFQ5_AMBMO|nr:unnamed protein product [Ambrosiozyma monospora]
MTGTSILAELTAGYLFAHDFNQLSKRENKGYVKFQGEKKTKQTVRKSNSPSKKVIDNFDMVHTGYLYTLNITIGSNKEPVVVQVDTGSSDFWIIGSNNSWCSWTSEGQGEYTEDTSRGSLHDCSLYGTFNSSKSDTWVNTGEPLDIVYIDGTGANCSLGTDNIEIDGVEIKDCYIAVSDEASENYGVLGIGPVNLEG